MVLSRGGYRVTLLVILQVSAFRQVSYLKARKLAPGNPPPSVLVGPADSELLGHSDLMMTQRSCDIFLGVPFNIASYALLTHLLAHVTDLEVGDLIVNFGDLHIYNNHFEQVTEQLSRDPYPLPMIRIADRLKGKGLEGLMDFKWEDVTIENYQYHAKIKAEVSV